MNIQPLICLNRLLAISFLLIFYCSICGFASFEHKQFAPNVQDLATRQFDVGKGNIFGVRDRWTYAQLLVAADFYQSWDDFRNTDRGNLLFGVIHARHAIDNDENGPRGDGFLTELEELLVDFSTFTFGDVLSNNRDHFQPYCRDRWKNDHQAAINDAKGGSLDAALARNGFADHFLTDCFAGGHTVDYADIRSKNYWTLTNGRWAVGTLHDLLNGLGPWGHNERGDVWRLYGDNHLNKSPDQLQKRLILAAVYFSVDDIYRASRGEEVPLVHYEYCRKHDTLPDTTICTYSKLYRAEALIPTLGKTVTGNLFPTTPPINQRPNADIIIFRNRPLGSVVPFQLTGYDSDDDNLTFFVDKFPAHGTVTNLGSSKFVYKPDPNFAGQDSLDYIARDPHGLNSEPGKVFFHIINLPPQAFAASYKINPEQCISFKPTVKDERRDLLEFFVTNQPEHGRVTVIPGSLYEMEYCVDFLFPPEPLVEGEDRFEYIAQDSLGLEVSRP